MAHRSTIYSSSALVGGKVILGGRDKMIRALDAATGKVVIGTQDGTVFAFGS